MRTVVRISLRDKPAQVMLFVKHELEEAEGLSPDRCTPEQIKLARQLWNCESAKRGKAQKRKLKAEKAIQERQ